MSAVDRFAAAVDSGRLRRDFAEKLDESPFSDVREWADSLTEIADAIDEAKEAVESWAFAEDRDERADAKDTALDALDSLVQAWNASPLDVDKLETWDPERDEEREHGPEMCDNCGVTHPIIRAATGAEQ